MRHDTTLNTISELSKKIDVLVEKQEKSENSMRSDSSKTTKDSK
jgi:hypothetical protein